VSISIQIIIYVKFYFYVMGMTIFYSSRGLRHGLSFSLLDLLAVFVSPLGFSQTPPIRAQRRSPSPPTYREKKVKISME